MAISDHTPLRVLSLAVVALAAFSCVRADEALDKKLFKAVAKGDLEKVTALLDDGATTSGYTDEKNGGINALFKAVMNDKLEIVQLLVDRGADVNSRATIEGSVASPLLAAMPKGNVDLMTFLLDKGANPNGDDDADFTPLHISCLMGKLKLAKLLLKYDLDLEIPVAKGSDDDETVMPGGVMGASALGVAVVGGQMELIKLVIDAGANTSGPKEAAFSPLMIASMQGHKDIVALLLEKGADVNMVARLSPTEREKDKSLDDADGATALIAAAGSGELEIVRQLLIYGTDTSIATSNGKTALSMADMASHFDCRGLVKSFEHAKDQRAWRACGGRTLKEYLKLHKLDKYAPHFTELGVEEPADMLELDDEDFDGMDMKKIHRKKYVSAALAQLKSDPPGLPVGAKAAAGAEHTEL